MKYLLLVYFKDYTESYYSNDIQILQKYASDNNFKNYKIYELNEVKNLKKYMVQKNNEIFL